MSHPVAIDLFCGLGGWTEGLLAERYDVYGFDIEQHVYGDMRYPAQLVVQDVLTLHGSQFKDASLIVASPPCQEYSYMAMPWSRAKQIRRALRGQDDFPDGYTGSRTIEELNALFNACYRIQREANEVWKNCYDAQERLEYMRKFKSQFDFRDLRDMLGCARGEYFCGYASELLY